jgi:ABC-type antimicrobial peptide transport system permease subunit
VSERQQQFGMLKCLGMTRIQGGLIVLLETLILGIITIPLGIIVGNLLQSGALYYFNWVLNNSGLFGANLPVFSLSFVPNVAIITAIITLIVILLSAIRPMIKAMRVPAIDAIRLADKVFVSNKESTRTEQDVFDMFGYGLFGYEGVLANKFIKRDKSGHRSVLKSLIVSLLLFICIAVFASYLNKRVEIMLDGREYNIQIALTGDIDFQDDVLEYISSQEDLFFTYEQSISTYPPTGETMVDSRFLIKTNNVAAFLSEINEKFPTAPGRRLFIHLFDEDRIIVLIFQLVGFSLVTIISLIAITNIVSVVAASIMLRKRDFATLYSAGMTEKGLGKLLYSEVFLYGFKALFISLPLGLFVSFGLYMFIQQAVIFHYSPPIIELAFATFGMLLIVFFTTLYSKRKLRNMNIIEVIKNEAV